MVLDILAMILIGAAALGAAIVVIHIITLTLEVIIDWFRDRAAEVETDPTKLAVTVAEQLESGNVSYVQGIFNTDTRAFIEARRIKAEEAEAAVKAEHRKHQVAVWS